MLAVDGSRTFTGELSELGYSMPGWCSVFLKGLLNPLFVGWTVFVHFQILLTELSGCCSGLFKEGEVCLGVKGL